jgi:membrane-associated phospholipid phosphatase
MISTVRRVLVCTCACVLTATPAAAQSQAAEAEMPSVRSLFTDLGQDVAHLRTWSTVETLAAGGGIAAALKHEDARLTRHAAGARGAEEILDPGEVIGDGTLQAAGALATYVVARATHNVRGAVLGARLFRAQVLSGGITQGLKYAIRRERPDHGRNSFPSGHASAAFATATVMERTFGWKAGVAAYATAAYVGVSRLSENKHYASDVAFGAAIGIISGRAVMLGHGKTRLEVSPFFSRRTREAGATVAIRRVD